MSTNGFRGIVIVFLSTMLPSQIVLAKTASSEFNFTATFAGGSCEIIAPESIEFNGGSEVRAREIEEGSEKATTQFNLTMSNCSGSGLTPTITVIGEKTSNFGSEPLFRDSTGSGESDGYGLLLGTLGNSDFSKTENLALTGKISALNWNTSNQLNMMVTSLPMIATLTCGQCNYSGRQGGEFKSTITFEFVYE